MDIELPSNDVDVKRERGSEEYSLLMRVYTPDDTMYSMEKQLNNLIEERVHRRSDITESVVREAAHSMYTHVEEREEINEVDAVQAIEVKVEQALRRTPYEAMEWRTDE
jgi:hypothetical protein